VSVVQLCTPLLHVQLMQRLTTLAALLAHGAGGIGGDETSVPGDEFEPVLHFTQYVVKHDVPAVRTAPTVSIVVPAGHTDVVCVVDEMATRPVSHAQGGSTDVVVVAAVVDDTHLPQ